MVFMVNFPRNEDDQRLAINESETIDCVDISIDDDKLNQQLCYTVNLEDLRLVIRKLSTK